MVSGCLLMKCGKYVLGSLKLGLKILLMGLAVGLDLAGGGGVGGRGLRLAPRSFSSIAMSSSSSMLLLLVLVSGWGGSVDELGRALEMLVFF